MIRLPLELGGKMKTKKYKMTGWQVVKREAIIEVEVLEKDTEDDLWEKAFYKANEIKIEDTKIIEDSDFIDWDECEDV